MSAAARGRDDADVDVEMSSSSSSSLCVDNSSSVIAKIANLYAERLMSDVCLIVGNVSKNRAHF